MTGRRSSAPGSLTAAVALLSLLGVAALLPTPAPAADYAATRSQPGYAIPSSYSAPLDARFYEEIQHLPQDHRIRRIASGVGRFEILVAGQTRWLERRCTASLISDRYILTAYHCLTSALFPYGQLNIAAVRFRLGFLSEAEPGVVWRIDPKPVADNFSVIANLDYAVLRILPDRRLGRPTAGFRAIRLASIDPRPNMALFIIHHPDGANQRLTLQDCRVTILTTEEYPIANTFPHRCDTRAGSSGAPVFAEQLGAAIALHHMGVNRWQANFAMRISAIATDSDIVASLVGSAEAPAPDPPAEPSAPDLPAKPSAPDLRNARWLP